VKYTLAILAGVLFYLAVTGIEWLIPGAVVATLACIDMMLWEVAKAHG
jgi:Na+-translocating ferredoxin:NAD+ oxidoreductase RnfD subunit